MVEWTLRRARDNDADALAACIDAAYAHYAETIADLPAVSQDCAGQIATLQVWIAETAGDLVGSVVLDQDEGTMKIVNVAVHPEQKGKGLGRALMGHAESLARERGCVEMRLTTHARMPDNHRFYQRLGWSEQARDGNKVVMSKPV